MGKDINDISRGSIKNFKWSSLLSGFADARSKEECDTTIMAGLPGHVPYEKDMIKEWEAPYLFFRMGILGLFIFFLVILAQHMFFWGNSLMIGIVPFIIPLTMLVFFWEMNIPRNISLLDSVGIMLFAGIACFYIVFFAMSITGAAYSNYLAPLIFGVTKLLLICICLRKKNRGYGLNGILIGAAVGAGYSAIITGEQIFELANYSAGGQGFISSVVLLCVFQFGSDIVWTATFGGALALSKGKEKISLKHFGNSLFIICFLGMYLIELLWNCNLYDFFSRFADNSAAVAIYNFLEMYQGRYILLMLLAWAMLLFVARKCIVESYTIAENARTEEKRLNANFEEKVGEGLEVFALSGKLGGKKYSSSRGSLSFGRTKECSVRYEEGTKGISGSHCRIYKSEKGYVLVDQNSTYGTYLADGTKLEAGREYIIHDGIEFYLASPENRFKIALHDESKSSVKRGLLSVGRRTNEPREQEDGKKVYVAIALFFVAIFLVMYFVSGSAGFNNVTSSGTQTSEQSIEGAWKGEDYNIKELILRGVDNVAVLAEINVFKESYANGITFTQDGKAYATYNGRSIDYADFDYSIVDENTLHLEWNYESISLEAGVSVKVIEAGVSKTMDDQTGYDAQYQINSDGTLVIDFFGQMLNMTK